MDDTSLSFVGDILKSASNLDKDDIHTTLCKLSNRVEEVKVELYEKIKTQYDFNPNIDAAATLTSRYDNFLEAMRTVEKNIVNEIDEQLNTSTSEFQELSRLLDDYSLKLAIVEEIVMLNDIWEKGVQAMKSERYAEAANASAEFTKLLDDGNPRKENIYVYKILIKEKNSFNMELCLQLENQWNDFIQWKPNKTSCQLVIKKNIDRGQLVQALRTLSIFDKLFSRFCEKLMKDIIIPISQQQACDIRKAANVVDITISSENERHEKEALRTCTQNLLSLFDTLNKTLLNTQLDEEDSRTLMNCLWERNGKDIIETIISECLSKTIPKSNSELSGYDAVKTLVGNMETKLHDIGLIPGDNTDLTDYVGSVDTLFTDQKTREILQKAHSLMKSGMHDMVLVGTGSGGEKQGKKTRSSVNNSENSTACLSANTFNFPLSYISSNIQELIGLLYHTMHEAGESSPECAMQLYYASRSVLLSFLEVVPTFHKQHLETLPALAALHHNNCMYISHHLLTLGHEFKPFLPEHHRKSITFVDMVSQMRQLGAECFLQMMRLQKETMIESLREAQGFVNMSEDRDNVNERRNKAVNQVLLQYRNLDKVWRDILPMKIYNKTMGTLINSLIIEMIDSITDLEDISSEDADDLGELVTMVTDNAGSMLQSEDKNEAVSPALLHKVIPKLTKFKELQIILKSNLDEISVRWADGMGPLAVEFDANEVKRLIRALFQNTDKRAQVLSKIR